MRWSPLARKEARTVAASKGVWLLAVLLVPWGYRPSYVGWDALGTNVTAGYVQVAGTVLLPLGVLLLSYRSVVGEPELGPPDRVAAAAAVDEQDRRLGAAVIGESVGRGPALMAHRLHTRTVGARRDKSIHVRTGS